MLVRLVFLIGPAIAVSLSTAVVASECSLPEYAPQVLVNELAAIEEAMAGCVSGDDRAARSQAERAEWERLLDQYEAFLQELCETYDCRSNLTGWVDLGGKPNFFGCEDFSQAVVWDLQGSLNYYSIRQEGRCRTIFYCHSVVVLTNDRTGEEFVLDPWAAEAGWIRGQQGRYDAKPYGDFMVSWPEPQNTFYETPGTCSGRGRREELCGQNNELDDPTVTRPTGPPVAGSTTIQMGFSRRKN